MTLRLHPAFKALALIALFILHLPMVAVAVFSFNSARYGMAWKGFTLDWYTRLVENERILEATQNTLVLAVVSTVIATILGTGLALGAGRYPWPRRFKGFLDFMVYLPTVTPDLIYAAALIVIFGVLRAVTSLFDPSLFTMILAHITFQIPFVALVVGSRLASIEPVIEEAARDLYADGWTVFRRIRFPLLFPGIIAAALLAFTLSLDDFIISFFTAGPDSTTLPIYIYSSVRRGVTPEIHALSLLIFALNVMIVMVMERLTRVRTA